MKLTNNIGTVYIGISVVVSTFNKVDIIGNTSKPNITSVEKLNKYFDIDFLSKTTDDFLLVRVPYSSVTSCKAISLSVKYI